MTLHFSRLTINDNPSTKALSFLLDPDNKNARADAHHRLIWSVFSDRHDQPRDFLWRADGKGRFYTLSRRRPSPSLDIFHPPETRPFEASLSIGDRLRYVMRANPIRVAVVDGKKRKVDVVMDALKDVPRGKRAEARPGIVREALGNWMSKQGSMKGFEPVSTIVSNYHQIHAGRKGKRRATHAVADLEGEIKITEPGSFMNALATGFGSAKAWGCGLMLIRRAQ